MNDYLRRRAGIRLRTFAAAVPDVTERECADQIGKTAANAIQLRSARKGALRRVGLELAHDEDARHGTSTPGVLPRDVAADAGIDNALRERTGFRFPG